MAKFTCPYCYEEHTINECKMHCSFNIAGNRNVTCKYKVERDADGWVLSANKSKCLKCREASIRIYCNAVEKVIPTIFSEGASLPIALVGAKASGKSNYIAVLINEIKRRMVQPFQCSLNTACSDESLRYYKDYYYKPLYEDSRVVEATDAGEIPPLIFPLSFMDSRGRIKDLAALTFYDTAGENLDSDDAMLVFNRYIPNSKGIILLLDPLQVPSIRRQLQGKMPLPVENTDTAEILSRIVNNIRDVKKVKKNIDIPLALVFTKMDALEMHGLLPPGSCLRDESEHLARGGFVISDFENTNIEMTALLENWLDGELLQMIKQFTKYSIFGLSALGGVPNGAKISTDEIKPKRVLDPLLWILAENGYVKTLKK